MHTGEPFCRNLSLWQPIRRLRAESGPRVRAVLGKEIDVDFIIAIQIGATLALLVGHFAIVVRNHLFGQK